MSVSVDRETTRGTTTTENVQEAIGTYESPQDEMEEKLTDILQKLLNVDRISRYDNFFALGGDSLLAVRLFAQLREIGLNTTVRKVIDAPSVAMLASNLTHHPAVTVPLNLITAESIEITPEMLPLITLSQAEIDEIVAQVPGGITNIQDIYGLTPLQNDILFHHLMAKKGDPHLIVNRLSFIDRYSLDRYADALQHVVERHDILRTAFIWEELSEPAQVVWRQVPSFLTEITLDDTGEPELKQLSHQFDPRHYRLDLTQAPLLRLLVAETSERSWIALQLMHHIIGDRITEEILQAEMYAIFNGRKEILSTPTPFRQVVGQDQLGIRPAEHTRFFTEMLADIDEPTLPFGLNDVDSIGAETNDINLKLLQTLSDQLRMHARNFQVNVASICHLAWAQVLSRASGREAVVFGTVLLVPLQLGEANGSVMGPMINTLPLRLDIDERSVDIAVRHTHARLCALLAHDHAALVLAQRCSGIPVNLPLFGALLSYFHNQRTGQHAASLPGVSFLGDEGRTNYPLSMSLDDNDNDLCLSAQVMIPMSAARICAYMQQSLQSLVDKLTYTPQKPIRALTVLPMEERTLLLHTWNQTAITHSPVCYLHQLFEAQVECNENAIAVESEGQTLSYVELNVQGNQLAHYLISKDVKPDDRIALCVERSTTMIVAMVGTLKSGCAYVPLDPVYPSQRLTNILHDADPIFLLADATGRKALGRHQVPVIELEKPLPTNMPIDNPNTNKLELTIAHLAYVIYTSGSTGTPKGVMVEHKQVVRFFEATHNIFDFNKQDQWCFFHSISFDISIWEIWGALCCGGQLSVVPQNTIGSPDEFYDWICARGITVLTQTTSAFKILMRAKNISSQIHRLRHVSLGAEVLDPHIVKKWYDTYDKCQTILVNNYGPTETIMIATSWICDSKMSKNSLIPIGRPLSDKRIYLLDLQGEPVPLGAEGEIYIGGAGVARGYLNRPELNAERFVSDPFSETPAARMYRTGDRARYLSDGNLVCLGRIDQQMKIRGFRIEVGEIEARLVEHPQIHEAVVQPYGNGTYTRLVAYVVADADINLVQNLRTYLSTLLPDYMIPAAYVCLPSLPLTPSGKLDRRALPAPDDKAFVRQQYKAPQGGMEEKLTDIWCKLLNIDRISRHDNFFALGGHSLLAVRLLTQLREVGLDTTVQAVFNAPTLAKLASTLTHYRAVTIPPNLITVDSTEITPEMLPLITLSQLEIDKIVAQVPGGVANIQDIYGLTPLQNGILFHHLMAKKGDPYLAVNQKSFIDRTSLERYADALQEIIKRHDILRTAFIWEEISEPAQVVWRQVPSLFTEIILDETEEPALELLRRRFDPRRHRLDLTQAPLLRLLVAKASEGSWIALQLMHHIIGDHITEEILQTEMHAIFDKRNETLSNPIPFRQIVGQARMGISASEHTRFFTEMLADIDEPTLPFGLSDVWRDGAEINEAYLNLSQTINDQLRLHARNLQVGLASICHLAWAHILCKSSGREAVVFGTVLLGRQTGERDNSSIGLMINTLPLRLDIDDRSVEIAVRHTHVRLSALLALAHAPLVLAQRCSGVPAGLPLFSALLNYRHNQQSGNVTAPLPGVISIESEERDNYPLSLSVEDDGCSLGLTAQVSSEIAVTRICEYMKQSLESLVDAITNTPQKPIRALTVLPPEERTLLLHTWNQTSVTHSPVCCIQQLFEAQVECDGQAMAVECEGQTLSYEQLNFKSNQLAHYLISKGVQPDHLIALCVERSTTMIAVMLGILKSGCAYVPLDPVYPSQRLTDILQDCDPILLLADSNGLAALRNHQVPVIELEKRLPTGLPTGLPIGNPNATKLGVTTANLAYVIYTSGSTGTPKGVMVEHQQIVRLFETTHYNFDLNKYDKWGLFLSISFDVPVWEIWGALLYGSQLSILPYDIARSQDEFYNWICTRGITVLNPTPTAFKMLMRATEFSLRLDRLRYVMLGGEELDQIIVKDWYDKYDQNGTMLVNMYGPTETIVQATFQRIESSENINSIGRPLPDLRIYLIDAHGEPVLLGVEGEIYIGGAGVARGYLNRPKLTSEYFLPDPFSESLAARMYRTGDRARYLPDGNLVFLGRMDQQVKIRGFRIEPGEIETRLVEHPQVYEAVVQPHGNGSDARLVAYVVADADTYLAQKLRSYLLTLLPGYMVPAAYVCLPSLPLTPNGKLDRRALPAPDDEAFVRQQFEAPQGEIEQKLSDIWSEVLSVDRISRNDNFFELGGHSLFVMHFVNKAKLYNMRIDARGVFSFPILKNLAENFTSRSRRFHCEFAIPVRRYGNEAPLFLLPDGKGDISYAFELAQDIDKNIPIYVLPWPSPENEQSSSIEEMANAMVPLIKEVRTSGPCTVAGYSSGGILAFEITKQLIKSDYPVSFLGLIDTYAPIAHFEASFSETEMLLTSLRNNVPVFKAFNNSMWWTRVSNLTLNEAIDEIHKTHLDLHNTDIEWEVLLSKQCYNYHNICAAFIIDSLPIKIHLFKALDSNVELDASENILYQNYKKIMYNEKLFNYPKLGWENYNLSTDLNIMSVNGNHQTMITDPKNRSILGKGLTKFLKLKTVET